MTFNPVTGVVSGTPTETGVFSFTVKASDAETPEVTRTFSFHIAAAGEELPPHHMIDTSVSPANAGATTGSGSYNTGSDITVAATPEPGFAFAHWTDNGAVVSASASYTFTTEVNRSLVAHFVPALTIQLAAGAAVVAWPTNFTGFVLQQNTALNTTNWVNTTNALRVVGATQQAVLSPSTGKAFFRLVQP